MSKTHLQLNKETLVIIIVAMIVIFLVVFNLAVLVPKLIEVYTPNIQGQRQEPIDADTIDKAIEYISP